MVVRWWGLGLGVVAVCCWSAPSFAEADSTVAVGMGVHSTIHLSNATNVGDEIGAGAQLRLKFLRFLALRLDYDFGHEAQFQLDQATKLADLVPYPDLRAALGLCPYPNKYVSPFITFGAGINTGVGFGDPVMLAGLALETTLYQHWVVGAGFQVYYATPGRISNFVVQDATRHAAALQTDKAATQKLEGMVARGTVPLSQLLQTYAIDYTVGDFLAPGAYQVGIELSYYF